MKRVLALLVVLAALGAGSASAAPPKTGTVSVALQSPFAFAGLQGGQGDTVLGLKGTLNVVLLGPQLAVVYGGELSGTGASGAVYSLGNAIGVLSPFGSTLAFVARVTAPSAAGQALKDQALADRDAAGKFRDAAKQLEADAAANQTDAERLRAEAQAERDRADQFIADAQAAEARAAVLEAPVVTCVTASAKIAGGTVSVISAVPCPHL
jgi:hypothetical protein